MTGKPVVLGPFKGGMHNSAGKDFIEDDEIYELVNLEVDSNGTLVNRPAIQELSWTLSGSKSGVRILGSFLPSDGRRFLVIMTGGTVRLMDLSTNTISISSGSGAGLTNACVVQYRNRLYVVPGPADTPGTGGYFDVSGAFAAVTWTTTAAIPAGGAVFLYKDRLWVVAGLQSLSNSSRLRFSAVGDGTTWNGSDFIDVYDSNGEKLVYGIVLGNDIVLFKQHSTFQLSYDVSPSRATIRQVSSNIGVPVEGCAVQYDNSAVYVMHGGAVYEMYNYMFTRISDNVDMSTTGDASLYSDMTFGLSIYRDRMFVRYYGNLYCYALKTGTWSRWVTTNKFSRLTVISSADLGQDLAYMASATNAQDGKLFFMQDSRTEGVGSGETYNCSITTKVYEFDTPHLYKRLWYWGLEIATSANTTATAILPNTGRDPTWAEDEAFTWDELASTPWGSAEDLNHVTIIPPDKGGYAKKFYKLPKAFRFKRAYFTVSTPAVTNTVDNSSVRVFSLLAFIRSAQAVDEKVN